MMVKVFDAAAIVGAIFTAAYFWQQDPILAVLAAPIGGLLIAPFAVGIAFELRSLQPRVLAWRNSLSSEREAIPHGVVWC